MWEKLAIALLMTPMLMWSSPENPENVVVRFDAHEAGAYTVRAGKRVFAGKHGPGEQIKVIPIRSFERDSGSKVADGKLEFSSNTAGVKLLSAVFSEGNEIEDGTLCFVEEAASHNGVKTLHPLNGIVTNDVYPHIYRNFPDSLPDLFARVGGVKLPLIRKNGGPNQLYIGRTAALESGKFTVSELDQIPFNGFVIQEKDGALFIAGGSIQGTAYGVYRFLEQQGLRFYAPGVASSVKTNPLLHYTPTQDAPYFEGKRVSGDWCVYGDSSGSFSLADPRSAGIDSEPLFDKTLWLDHDSSFLVPKKLYYEKHPEYYILRGDGKRIPADTTDNRLIVCQTNPGGLQTAAERALKWIEKNPQHLLYVIQQGDDGEYCVCDVCNAQRKLGWNESDLFLHWLNFIAGKVAERYPKKRLLAYAYILTQSPPSVNKVAHNVDLLYAAWPNRISTPDGFHDFDAPGNKIAREQILQWASMHNNPSMIGIYDYPAGSSLTHRGMAARLKWLARRNFRGSIWYCGQNQIFRNLFVWVQAQLNWNPLQDTRSLEDEFITNYYGAAAPVVKRIFENIYNDLERNPANNTRFPASGFFTKSRLDSLFADFEAAHKLAPEKLKQELLTDERGILENAVWSNPSDPVMRALVWKHYLTLVSTERNPPWHSVAEALWATQRVRLPRLTGSKMNDVVNEFILDFEAAVRKYSKNKTIVQIPNGIRLSPYAFTGGGMPGIYNWKCPPRDAVAVYGRMTTDWRIRANFDWSGSGTAKLTLIGQSCDKLAVPPAPIAILLNGKTIFEGVNGCIKQGWTTRSFEVPAGILKSGKNEIVIENLYHSDSRASHWFMLSDVDITRIP